MHVSVNGEYTSLTEEEMNEIDRGLSAIKGCLVPNFDFDNGENFSYRKCDCCKTTKGGNRYAFVEIVH
jgi:hypothetical protein